MIDYGVLLVVIGSVLAAAAQSAGMHIAGHVQGLCMRLLLIAAVPRAGDRRSRGEDACPRW